VITLITAKKETLVAGVAAMSVVVLLNPLAFYRNLQEYTSSNFTIPPASLSDNPISIRTSLWWLSGQAISEINPVFGSGTGDVNDTIAILADKHNAHNILNTSDPHNQYLHTFIALGAVGLLALLAVFFAPLLMLFKQREFLACVGLIAFMVICLTESALELQKGIVLFSLFVSLTGNQFREWRFMTQRLKYA
jgi:O-antigen ligase